MEKSFLTSLAMTPTNLAVFAAFIAMVGKWAGFPITEEMVTITYNSITDLVAALALWAVAYKGRNKAVDTQVKVAVWPVAS